MVSAPTTSPALHWTTLGLSVAVAYLCWPLWPALVLAAWTAALLRPLLSRLARRLHGQPRAAALLSLLLFLVLAAPLGLITLGVISGVAELVQIVGQTPSAKSVLEAIAVGPTGTPLPAIPVDVAGVLELLERYGAEGMTALSTVAGAATGGLVGLFIYFGGSYVFLLDGPRIWQWMARNSPLAPTQLERLTAAFQETGRGLIVGVGLTAATQGLVATAVYVALGVPRWWVLGPITGVASMIPMIGSTLVWAPVAVGFYLTGHPVKALILCVLGIGVISSVDNILRPVYARMGALKLPIFLLFVSIFGGIAAFGTWGAILGPLVARLWLEALALRREAAGTPDASWC